jgi:hypothetical protein
VSALQVRRGDDAPQRCHLGIKRGVPTTLTATSFGLSHLMTSVLPMTSGLPLGVVAIRVTTANGSLVPAVLFCLFLFFGVRGKT